MAVPTRSSHPTKQSAHQPLRLRKKPTAPATAPAPQAEIPAAAQAKANAQAATNPTPLALPNSLWTLDLALSAAFAQTPVCWRMLRPNSNFALGALPPFEQAVWQSGDNLRLALAQTPQPNQQQRPPQQRPHPQRNQRTQRIESETTDLSSPWNTLVGWLQELIEHYAASHPQSVVQILLSLKANSTLASQVTSSEPMQHWLKQAPASAAVLKAVWSNAYLLSQPKLTGPRLRLLNFKQQLQHDLRQLGDAVFEHDFTPAALVLERLQHHALTLDHKLHPHSVRHEKTSFTFSTFEAETVAADDPEAYAACKREQHAQALLLGQEVDFSLEQTLGQALVTISEPLTHAYSQGDLTAAAALVDQITAHYAQTQNQLCLTLLDTLLWGTAECMARVAHDTNAANLQALKSHQLADEIQARLSKELQSYQPDWNNLGLPLTSFTIGAPWPAAAIHVWYTLVQRLSHSQFSKALASEAARFQLSKLPHLASQKAQPYSSLDGLQYLQLHYLSLLVQPALQLWTLLSSDSTQTQTQAHKLHSLVPDATASLPAQHAQSKLELDLALLNSDSLLPLLESCASLYELAQLYLELNEPLSLALLEVFLQLQDTSLGTNPQRAAGWQLYHRAVTQFKDQTATVATFLRNSQSPAALWQQVRLQLAGQSNYAQLYQQRQQALQLLAIAQPNQVWELLQEPAQATPTEIQNSADHGTNTASQAKANTPAKISTLDYIIRSTQQLSAQPTMEPLKLPAQSEPAQPMPAVPTMPTVLPTSLPAKLPASAPAGADSLRSSLGSPSAKGRSATQATAGAGITSAAKAPLKLKKPLSLKKPSLSTTAPAPQANPSALCTEPNKTTDQSLGTGGAGDAGERTANTEKTVGTERTETTMLSPLFLKLNAQIDLSLSPSAWLKQLGERALQPSAAADKNAKAAQAAKMEGKEAPCYHWGAYGILQQLPETCVLSGLTTKRSELTAPDQLPYSYLLPEIFALQAMLYLEGFGTGQHPHMATLSALACARCLQQVTPEQGLQTCKNITWCYDHLLPENRTLVQELTSFKGQTAAWILLSLSHAYGLGGTSIELKRSQYFAELAAQRGVEVGKLNRKLISHLKTRRAPKTARSK